MTDKKKLRKEGRQWSNRNCYWRRGRLSLLIGIGDRRLVVSAKEAAGSERWGMLPGRWTNRWWCGSQIGRLGSRVLSVVRDSQSSLLFTVKFHSAEQLGWNYRAWMQYSQHYATIPPKLKTHADNTKHGFYCYNFITTMCVVPGAGLEPAWSYLRGILSLGDSTSLHSPAHLTSC